MLLNPLKIDMNYCWLLIILLPLQFQLSAQNPVYPLHTDELSVEDGAYVKDMNNELDKYEGKWIYDNGTSHFKVILTKVMSEVEFPSGEKVYVDVIKGVYEYIENGEIVTSTLNFWNPADFQPIYGNYMATQNELVLVFIDIDSNHLLGILKLTCDPTTQRLAWNLINRQSGIKIIEPNQEPEDPIFLVPTNITLSLE